MKYCTACGEPLNDDCRFCSKCGAEQIPVSIEKAAEITNATISENATEIIDDGITTTSPSSPDLDNAEDIPDSPVSNNGLQKNLFAKKHALVLGLAFCAIVVICIILYISSSTSLSNEDKYAINMVEKYQNMLKDPDSIILRGDVVTIYKYDDEESELHRYCFFIASGTNSYGASVKSFVTFRDDEFIDDLDADLTIDDFDSTDEYLVYLDAEVVYAVYSYYSLVGTDITDIEGYISCTITAGKTVGKKLKISYTE